MLRRVEGPTVALARERKAIFEAWKRAFHRGEATQETHPGIPGQHPRFAELSQAIDAAIASAPIVKKGRGGKIRTRW